MRKRSYQEQADDLERRIEALRAQRRQALARHGEEERKGELRARNVIGALVLEQFPEGWRGVDFHRLEEVLEKNPGAFAACTGEVLPVRDAMARMRMWERTRMAPTSRAETRAAGDE